MYTHKRKAQTLANRARAIGFTRAVIHNKGFLVPPGPGDSVAALHAVDAGLVHPEMRAAGYGYAANVTIRELDEMTARY